MNLFIPPAAPGFDPHLVMAASGDTAHTLTLTEDGKLLRLTANAAVTLTVPAHADVPFPTGTQIVFAQAGTGAVTVTAAGGVTVTSRRGYVTTGAGAVATLIKTDTNTWLLTGDLGA